MTRLARWATTWPFVSFIGVVLVATEIWALGPLLALGRVHPLEGRGVRLAAMAAALAIWLVAVTVARLRARRRNRALIGELAAQGAAEADSEAASAEEIAHLREEMTRALNALRRARLGRGRRWLYQLPWYMLIGPPGAGKTTALTNSGLGFPMADRFGPRAVRGIGGTRHCDWWFSDEAVLIDTAGRYTTQDSRQPVDSAAWLGFLDLLGRRRPRQPINGAILAISLAELAMQSDAERLAHAVAIGQRLQELETRFGRTVPVYVVFTKADLITGFREFFDPLDPAGRAQVWGFTFPLPRTRRPVPLDLPLVQQEFDQLVGRLNERLLERLRQEPDRQRRALIFGFPAQFGSYQPLLMETLVEIVRHAGKHPIVRGVYFTSATQEGTPTDRLASGLMKLFRLDAGLLSGYAGLGRSYFLLDLLRSVIFAEAEVAGQDPVADRRRRWARGLAAGGMAAVFLAAVAAVGASFFSNQALIRHADAAAASFDTGAGELIFQPVADSGIAAVLPALDLLRGLARQPPAGGNALLVDPAGLSQSGKLADAAAVAYGRALDRLLLPRAILLLEQHIAGAVAAATTPDGPVDALEQDLRTYLMLGGQGPLDRAAVGQALMAAFAGVPENGSIPEPALRPHVDALVARLPTAAYPLDGALISAARAALMATPPASQSYARLMRRAGAAAPAMWTVANHIDATDGLLLASASGGSQPLGVPGLFTAEGFRDAVLPLLAEAGRLAPDAEAWVLGDPPPEAEAAAADMQADLLDRYRREFVSHWTSLLANLRIAPLTDQASAEAALGRLAQPGSPLLRILAEVAAEADGTAMALDAARAFTGVAKADADPQLRALRDLAAPAEGGDGSALDRLAAALEAARAYLQQVGEAADPAAALGASDAASPDPPAALALVAAQLPPALEPQITALAEQVATLAAGAVRDRLQTLWESTGLPACQTLVAGRYPVVAGSATDMPPEDFARLFGPGGTMDSFYRSHLRAAVDPRNGRWRAPLATGEDGLSEASLWPFQRAERIGRAFLGGGAPAIAFQIAPVLLDAGATQAILDVAGQQVTYAHGPLIARDLRWAAGDGPVSLTLQPELPGEDSTIRFGGPWALLRLLDAADTERGADGWLHATFRVGSRTATFEFRSSASPDPLGLSDLADFRCPAQL